MVIKDIKHKWFVEIIAVNCHVFLVHSRNESSVVRTADDVLVCGAEFRVEDVTYDFDDDEWQISLLSQDESPRGWTNRAVIQQVEEMLGSGWKWNAMISSHNTDPSSPLEWCDLKKLLV